MKWYREAAKPVKEKSKSPSEVYLLRVKRLEQMQADMYWRAKHGGEK